MSSPRAGEGDLAVGTAGRICFLLHLDLCFSCTFLCVIYTLLATCRGSVADKRGAGIAVTLLLRECMQGGENFSGHEGMPSARNNAAGKVGDELVSTY